MNMEQLKGNWKQLMGKARTQWGKLTDDDLEQIAGKKDELVGKLQVRYGHARDQAEREVDSWLNKL
ncbi:MAG: CsbD family protein [Polyangiaceae bacterium]